MREIKLRVWDEARKKMVYEFDVNFTDNPVAYVLLTKDDNSIFCGNYLDNGDWQELEADQYTGLKDKNGVEVFELDIVTWEDSVSDDMYGGGKVYPEETVEFKGGAFYPVCMMPETEFEVIGNIHQPE